jgi:ribosomal protein S18 acetylase RimI-like enzyme
MVKIRGMTIADFDGICEVWKNHKGTNPVDDSAEGFAKYIRRNPTTSFVAEDNGKIVGTILAGHDGRRGFIHHMAVMPEYRRQRIGHSLAEKAIEKIKAEGIDKTHIFSYQNNSTGQSFWSDFGFEKRDDVFVFSYDNNK